MSLNQPVLLFKSEKYKIKNNALPNKLVRIKLSTSSNQNKKIKKFTLHLLQLKYWSSREIYFWFAKFQLFGNCTLNFISVKLIIKLYENRFLQLFEFITNHKVEKYSKKKQIHMYFVSKITQSIQKLFTSK